MVMWPRLSSGNVRRISFESAALRIPAAVAMSGGTSNLQAGEIFKIRAGKIHEIEAMGTSLPYGIKSPWE